MSAGTDAPATRTKVVVCVILRGQDTVCPVEVDSIDQAVATCLFAATHFLRKAPGDRAFAWAIGDAGENTILKADGVAIERTFVPRAIFDPREVVGVLWSTRSIDSWKDGE